MQQFVHGSLVGLEPPGGLNPRQRNQSSDPISVSICLLMESDISSLRLQEQEETPPSFCIVDVHLSDDPFAHLAKKAFLSVERDEDELEASLLQMPKPGLPIAEADEEELEDSLLQMSKLGLPTSFASAPRRSNRRRHRKSLSQGRLIASAISDDVILETNFPSGSAQMVGEGSVEDEYVRGFNYKSNQSDVNTVAYSVLSAENFRSDGEASASSCQPISLQKQLCEPVSKSVAEISVLPLSRESSYCEGLIISDKSMAVPIATNYENSLCDHMETLENDGLVVPSCGADFVDEEYAHSQGEVMDVPASAGTQMSDVTPTNVLKDSAERLQQNSSRILNDGESCPDEDGEFCAGAINQVADSDVVSTMDSADNVHSGSQTGEFPVGATEIDDRAEISQFSAAGASRWSACWDNYYCRYYFYNVDTKESTWEPPEGLEAYGSVSSVQGHDAGVAANVEPTVIMPHVSRAHSEEPSAVDIQFPETGPSFAESVSKSFYDGGADERFANKDIVVGIHKDISNVQEDMEPSVEEVYDKPSQLPILGNDLWSVCWDDHYGRYYFFNAKTLESTWEPPKGFEAYGNDTSKSFISDDLKSKALSLEEGQVETAMKNGCNMGTLPEADETILCASITSEGCTGHAEAMPDCKVAMLSKRANRSAQYFLHLARQNKDCAAGSPIISKYWFQRFRLFSKYDMGIKLDEEGWFSVTPEAIAKHQAARCRKDALIVDAFCGVGGNAIQFALAGYQVVAIDNDVRRIEHASHNAEIYGVSDCIDFVVGDFFIVSSSMVADVVFLSPPWGGPDYLDAPVYDILTMLQPKDGVTLLNAARLLAPNIILYLPRNVDINQLAELQNNLSFLCSCEVERIFLNGKLKAITAYYGQFTSTCPHTAAPDK